MKALADWWYTYLPENVWRRREDERKYQSGSASFCSMLGRTVGRSWSLGCGWSVTADLSACNMTALVRGSVESACCWIVGTIFCGDNNASWPRQPAMTLRQSSSVVLFWSNKVVTYTPSLCFDEGKAPDPSPLYRPVCFRQIRKQGSVIETLSLQIIQLKFGGDVLRCPSMLSGKLTLKMMIERLLVNRYLICFN